MPWLRHHTPDRQMRREDWGCIFFKYFACTLIKFYKAEHSFREKKNKQTKKHHTSQAALKYAFRTHPGRRQRKVNGIRETNNSWKNNLAISPFIQQQIYEWEEQKGRETKYWIYSQTRLKVIIYSQRLAGEGRKVKWEWKELREATERIVLSGFLISFVHFTPLSSAPPLTASHLGRWALQCYVVQWGNLHSFTPYLSLVTLNLILAVGTQNSHS